MLVAGLKAVRRIMAAPAMQRFVEHEHEPGASMVGDEEILDYIRQRGTTAYHPTTTCRMGTDAGAVVDPRLRVHRIGGLRVVDASVMPALVSGHTNAPTIMIAEKAADMIRADAKAGQMQLV